MKKTFKLLAFALVASLVALTSCTPDDDENNPTTPPVEQPELSYTFEDVASWTPQTVEFGYDTLGFDGVYAGGYISQNNMSFYEANEIMERCNEIAAYEQLKNSFILMFSGTPGNFDWELEFFEGAPVLDYGVMYLDGLTQLMGQTIPLIWISENMTVTVTKFDMANQKLSLTLTATMRDMVSLMMGASGNDQGAKTFTLSVKNYPMSDWGLEDLEKLVAKMEKLK